jgi:hypothetical protein
MSMGLESETSPLLGEQRSWGRQLADFFGISVYEWEQGLSSEEAAYRDKLSQYSRVLNESMRLEWIGGYDVQQEMEQVGKLADSGRWEKAVQKLDAAKATADAVLTRKPYVDVRKAHENQIKAAKNLKKIPNEPGKKSYGQTVEEMWDEAERLAAAKDFTAATAQIRSIADYLEKTVNADKTVTEGRAKVATDELLLASGMRAEMEKPELDLEKLRGLAIAELKRGKDAAALGIDPGAKAREPLDPADEPSCHDLFVNYGWFSMKAAIKTGAFEDGTPFSKEIMWKCWRYRQKVVTAEIDKLRRTYPTLIAKASGSEDLESDIDITFATPNSGDDVRAAKDFNKAMQSEFKKPPGRVFDVNIYARDYGAVKESFNKDFSLAPQADRAVDQPDDTRIQKLSQIDQDVATLLKQRRFMEGGEYQSHVDSILKSLKDPVIRARTQKQFEEAESIYFLTLQDKIEGIRKKITAQIAAIKSPNTPPPQLQKMQAELAILDKLRDQGDVDGYQKKMQQVMTELELKFPAEVMDATDDMYLDRMGDLRDNQAQITKLQNAKAKPADHHPGVECATAHPDEEHEAWRKKKLNSLEAQVKKDMFTNIVFANEAYMSEGAIQHVVAGMQGATPEAKEAALRDLNAATLVQSCNEQLADFFKDMQHYTHEVDEIEGGEDPTKAKKARQTSGEAYVHASKYLFRLLDGARVLAEKFAAAEPPLTLQWFTDLAIPGDTLAKQVKSLQDTVDGFLYQLRKCSSIEPSVKGELAVDEVNRVLKVANVRAFTAKIGDLGKEINAKVRAHKDFAPELTADRQAEAEYFKYREAPDATPREKSLNKLRLGLRNPLNVSAKADVSAALTELGESPAAVIAQWEATVGALQTMSAS